jgi:hypothetical protein
LYEQIASGLFNSIFSGHLMAFADHLVDLYLSISFGKEKKNRNNTSRYLAIFVVIIKNVSCHCSVNEWNVGSQRSLHSTTRH